VTSKEQELRTAFGFVRIAQKLVDSDVVRFSAAVLRGWKLEVEC
jgi:hypothetical protein